VALSSNLYFGQVLLNTSLSVAYHRFHLMNVTRLAVIATTLAFVASVASAPTFDEWTNNGAPDAPHFVIYSDKLLSGTTPSVDKIAGYNVL
jgi:hypothetical protein